MAKWDRERRITRFNGYKELAEANGSSWELLYFEIDPETQWQRLSDRNSGDLKNTHFISRQEMELFASMFQPPNDEGEIIMHPDSGEGIMLHNYRSHFVSRLPNLDTQLNLRGRLRSGTLFNPSTSM